MRVSSNTDAVASPVRSEAGAITASRPSSEARRAASSSATASGSAGREDARRVGAHAVGARRLHVGRDQLQERERELHDLARHAVGVLQLLDLGVRASREVRQEVLPAPVGDRPGRLGDVAEQRERPGDAAAGHAQLHRRQVLRLVHDHVAEGARRAVEQRGGLVEERQVARAPARAPPHEQALLVGVEDPVRGLLQPRAVAEQLLHDRLAA